MSELPNGIKNYEMYDRLGEGASARVYRGFDKTRKSEVAIKTIEKNQIISQNLWHRVREEAITHIKLKHPSILELYDAFEDDSYVYLILELCHKGQLQQYFDSHSKGLTDDETRVIMDQIIDGVQYLQKHGIVHRDLKPENILLTKDMKVKIADFGLAVRLEDPNEQHYTMCGTPNYMSPEVASRKAYGLETDVWSLGVILYTCLVGKKPFEANGTQATIEQVKQKKYKLPNTLSPDARDLIKKMLCEPEDRILLEDIKTHPFMKVKSTAAMMTKKVAEMSIDSGCGTVSSTKHSSSSSCSNVSAPSRRTRPMPAFPLQLETHREEDRSHMSIDSGAGFTGSLTCFSHSSSANVHSHISSASGHSSSANVYSHSSGANVHSHSSSANVHSHSSGANVYSHSSSANVHSHSSSANVHSHSSSANVHSHSSSARDRHPPSPPVRERDSQSEEELRRTRNAMRSIKFPLQQQNIHLAARGEAKARPGIHGCRNEQFTAAKSGTSDAAEATTDQMHFRSLPPNDHQKVERQQKAFDPRRYKDSDCTSCYTNSAFRPEQHNDRTDKYGHCLCEAQQPQQTSQIPVLHLENMQIQDLASSACNFLVKHETQERLKSSQPVEFIYNKVPIQFLSPEPASRNVKLTEQEIQHCLLESNKTARKSDNKQDSKEVCSLPPPFSTDGLTSVRQKIKNIVLHITDNGSVVVEITKKGTVETVTDVIIISCDGKRMMMYKPPAPVPVRDQPLPLPPPEQCETFEYPNIPEKHLRKYCYFAKVVKVLRAKIPKVTMYDSTAKCILSENGAFCMEFYDGVVAKSDGESVIIKEADGNFLTVSSERNSRLISETKEMLTCVQKLEEVLSIVQAILPGAKKLFPITVGRRPRGIKSAHKNVQALGNDKKLGEKAVSETTSLKSTLSKTPKTTTSTNSSSITSYPGSDSSSAHVRLKTNQGSVSDSNVHQRKVGDDVILKGSHLRVTASQSLNATSATTMSRENYSSSSDNSLARVELRGADVSSKTLVPEVGWAVVVNGGIDMFFFDGTHMDVKTDKITYWTSDGCCYKYNDENCLPAMVMEKLRKVQEVSILLSSSSSSSSR